ncbi:MAG: hypothetical protein ACREAK_11315, partial [Nitrosarchaeum sp.]
MVHRIFVLLCIVALFSNNFVGAYSQNATIQNVTIQNVTIQNVTIQNATSNVTIQNTPIQNVTPQNATSNVTPQNTTPPNTTQNATSNVTPHNTTQNSSPQNASPQNASPQNTQNAHSTDNHKTFFSKTKIEHPKINPKLFLLNNTENILDRSVNPSDDKIHVYIYLKDKENTPDNLNFLAKSDNIISVMIPRSQLDSIANSPQVSRIDLPIS